jgi:hypothetical protein
MNNVAIYNTYKQTAYNLKSIFRNFEHIHNCCNIFSLDKEINMAFGKISALYSKVMMAVGSQYTPATIPGINAPAQVMVKEKNTYLLHVISFLEQNDEVILNLIDSNGAEKFEYDLSRLEYTTMQITILIRRMEEMVRDSQNIYPVNLRAIA